MPRELVVDDHGFHFSAEQEELERWLNLDEPTRQALHQQLIANMDMNMLTIDYMSQATPEEQGGFAAWAQAALEELESIDRTGKPSQGWEKVDQLAPPSLKDKVEDYRDRRNALASADDILKAKGDTQQND